jgi:hypothetical protein
MKKSKYHSAEHKIMDYIKDVQDASVWNIQFEYSWFMNYKYLQECYVHIQ